MFELALRDHRLEAAGERALGGSRRARRAAAARRGPARASRAYLDSLERNEVPEERAPWARWAGSTTYAPGSSRSWRGSATRSSPSSSGSSGASRRCSWSGRAAPTSTSRSRLRLPLFVEEASVTAMLAERFPGYVPAPLAVEPERGWFLLPEFDDLIGWQPPLEVHEELFRRYAGLQRRSAEITVELLAAGCLDRRLHVLETQVDPLLDDPEAIGRLTPEEVAELRRLGPTLKEACRPPGCLRRSGHARPRRPPSRERRTDERRARLLRLDGRVHRASVLRPPLAAVAEGRGDASSSARGVPRRVGRGSSRTSACARLLRWPGS